MLSVAEAWFLWINCYIDKLSNYYIFTLTNTPKALLSGQALLHFHIDTFSHYHITTLSHFQIDAMVTMVAVDTMVSVGC